jgi:hypothetical protein
MTKIVTAQDKVQSRAAIFVAESFGSLADRAVRRPASQGDLSNQGPDYLVEMYQHMRSIQVVGN